MVVESRVDGNGLVLRVSVSELSESGLLYKLLGFDSVKGQVDGPEELPRGTIAGVVVREVLAELRLVLNDLIIELLDGYGGKILQQEPCWPQPRSRTGVIDTYLLLALHDMLHEQHRAVVIAGHADLDF